MQTMTRLLPWLTALTLLLTAGLLHGLWSERWQPSGALEEAVARLELVPLEIGDWQGTAIEVDAAAFAQAGARGYWARSYAHRHGGTVLVILMCGRSGRMAVHTPEVCYRGAGFDMLETPARTVLRDELGDEHGTFWNARFAKQATSTSQHRLSWAWSDGGDWQAPANPRWEFRGRPFLYKLYASHELSSPSDADATAEFLRVLLPELKKILG
jgi:hypothetical protein